MAKRTRQTKSKGVSKKAPSERRSSEGGRRASDTPGEAFIKLLQSPFVAELVAVAATAALAALGRAGLQQPRQAAAERRASGRGGRSRPPVSAAAAAVGRRLNTEIEEIRRAAKESKGGAKA